LEPLARTAPPLAAPLKNELRFRVFDVVATILILPFALVLSSLIALAVLADSPGPVLYRCRRVGYGGEVFEMVKFRKMRRDAVGSALTAYEDERFTPIGKFLSVTRLDELPQLWNVLKGDMRLVGPRPEMEEFVSHYPHEYEEILSVRPGLTGMAQLEFFDESRVFGEAHSHPRFYSEGILPHKIELDLQYVRNRSLRADIAIFLQTPVLPLRVAARKLAVVVAAQPRGHLVTYMGVALCALLLLVTFSTQT
jgi:lipopolysaccharide/colanic/teichoic acid biosynthesis glycosyltransferase